MLFEPHRSALTAPAFVRSAVVAVGLALMAVVGCQASPDSGGEHGEGSAVAAATAAPAAAEPAPPEASPPAEGVGLPQESALGRVAMFDPPLLPSPNEARAGDGLPGPAYWQQRADYVIDARLIPAEKRVEGVVRMTYTNNSPRELDLLWLNLPQNAFRAGSRSAAVRDTNNRFRSTPNPDWGFVLGEVTQDGTPVRVVEDDTRARVDLASPAEARGGVVRLEIPFSFIVPHPGSHRIGIKESELGEVFCIAHWFPHAAKYDDVRGWNTLPYLGAGEFYTDFGDYTVSITVPATFTVAGSGLLQNPNEVMDGAAVARLERAALRDEPVVIREPGDWQQGVSGERTWTFRAERVRTFAFATSAAYIWDAAGVEVDGARVLVQSFYPPEDRQVWGKISTEASRHAIEFYSRFFGLAYPYPSLANCWGSEGGMEYPMIMFCSGGRSEDSLFGVTDHEVLHQWVPMVVNTDERRHGWMDEGFDNFGNIYSRLAWNEKRRALGERKRDRPPGASVRSYMRRYADRDMPNIFATSDRAAAHGARGPLVYSKPAVGLVTLREHILGHDRFDRAMAVFLNAWAFKSPQPADFFRAMESAAGEDLGYFWRGWFAGTGSADIAIAEVRQPAEAESGKLEILLEDRGDFPLPAVVTVTLADGREIEARVPVEAWSAGRRHTLRVETGGVEAVEVQNDPRSVTPERNRDNDRWARDSQPAGTGATETE